MKLVDQKGRLFGLVNIVDLCVALAVLLAVGAIGVKLFADPIKEAVAPNSEMTTVFRIRGASDFLQAELERNPLEGKQMVAGNAFLDAVVTEVSFLPYETQVTTADGTIVSSLDPVKRDVQITVVSEISKGTATPKIGNQEVRAGRTFTFKTLDFEMNAHVETVIIND